MNSFSRAAVLTAAAITSLNAQAGVTFDANIESDTSYKASRNNPNSPSDTYQGGRIEINAKAELMKNGDSFVNAKASLIVPLSSDSVTVDDAWVQFGNSMLDFKLGRQEAADLFPLGKDTVVESAGPASGYRANTLRGRLKDGRVHGVIGFNAGTGLRAELGVITKKAGSASAYGFRPTLSYTTGPLTLRAGIESYRTEGKSESSVTGAGLSLGYAFGETKNVNINYARSSKLNASSLGANLTWDAAGLGYVQDRNHTANTKTNTVYAAYTFPLFNIKNASITPAISHSKGSQVDALTTYRVRINYAF